MLNQTDLSRADLNLLVLFETVMEERHVGRAAERLNLSPSAVSHGVARLRTLLNDPLFLKTPKGVAPTDRATDLAAPIADILARVRNVVATAAPFDPRTSKRRFTIGAPDGVSAVFLPPLMESLHSAAPYIDISIRQLLPRPNEPSPTLAWRDALADLEARAMDLAVIPSSDVPVRFETRALFSEDFVIALRARHPFAKGPSLKAYCAAEHLVVSHTGDAFGFVDTVLAQRKLTRRIALTVPNFMFALAVLAETDMIAALPRRFVAMHGARFGVTSLDAPLKLPGFQLNIVAPKVALNDVGLAWLMEILAQTGGAAKKTAQRRT